VDALQPLPDDWQRALCVVAHPDDLEYGAAAAVAVWTAAGKQIDYLLATRGEAGIDTVPPEQCAAIREAEQRAAAAIVGVTSVTFLDHHDGAIEHDLRLRRDLAAAIRRHRPELVVTLNHHDHWGGGWWNSPDHRNLGRGLLDAVLDAGNRWIHRDLLDGGLEPWGGVRWVAVAGSPSPTHAVAVADGFDRAVASLEAHARYLEALASGGGTGDARSFLESQARAAGERFGGRLATAFEVLVFG
jgi:LmbE family N-acetylglucosaminyl deacetylase